MFQEPSEGHVSPFYQFSNADRALKRALDLAFGVGGLVLFLPLFIVVAIALKLESGEPVFIRKLRYSCCNSPVWLLEFRTSVGTKDGVPRLSRIGRTLRRTRIDELPQLLNVLSGEMSLVGPKPHISAYNDYFQALADRSKARGFKPGLVSWAELNESFGKSGANNSMRRRIEYDIHYLENWSLWFDLRIIFLAITSRDVLLYAL